jgi:hypothetical protein
MKDKAPEEAVVAKLGSRPVFSKNMEQELMGYGTEVFWLHKARCQNGGFPNS